MPFICSIRNKATALLISALALGGGTVSATAQQVRCMIDAPAYALDSDPVGITITLSCGGEGTELPAGQELVLGMTVYSDPIEEAKFRLDDEMPPNPNGFDRIILGDEYAKRYDFPLMPFRVEEGVETISVDFTAPAGDMALHKYLLAVVWPVDAKFECDATDMFQRHGCQEYGYLVGSDLSELLIAYPGLVKMTTADENVSPIDVPRWVVEQFR